MKFSELWLREWVNPAIDSDALANQITIKRPNFRRSTSSAEKSPSIWGWTMR